MQVYSAQLNKKISFKRELTRKLKLFEQRIRAGTQHCRVKLIL